MARTLEGLVAGTPVFCGEQRVGEVRAVYAEGHARAVELIAVDWSARGTVVALPADEVEAIDERGVLLMHSDPAYYAELTTFDEARFPTVHRLP